MLMESPEVESLDENESGKPPRKKPLWSENAKQFHAFDYDDEDIVEYKEEEDEEENDKEEKVSLFTRGIVQL